MICQAFRIIDHPILPKDSQLGRKLIGRWFVFHQRALGGIAGIIYPMSTRRLRVILIIFCLFVIFLPACSRGSPVTTGTSAAPTTWPSGVTQEPSQTPVPPTPSPTPIPLAAVVNGEAITLAEFQGELARFQASTTITGTNLASDPNEIVLNELIDQTLLAQGAVENGFMVDETTLQSRIESLENQLGGTQALEDWKTEHGYSNDDFQLALRRSVGVAWMRDQIIAEVPQTAEEVHLRQILLPTSAEANEVYASLQSGADFLDLAFKYNPLTGGDLGWFPRGYLDSNAIEEAAFALQPEHTAQWSRRISDSTSCTLWKETQIIPCNLGRGAHYKNKPCRTGYSIAGIKVRYKSYCRNAYLKVNDVWIILIYPRLTNLIPGKDHQLVCGIS